MDEGDLYCNVRDDNFGTKIEIKQQREGGRGLHNLPNLRNIHNVAPLPAAAAALHDDSHICTITFKRSSSSPVPGPTVGVGGAAVIGQHGASAAAVARTATASAMAKNEMEIQQ